MFGRLGRLGPAWTLGVAAYASDHGIGTLHLLEVLVAVAMVAILIRRAQLLRRFRKKAGPEPGAGLALTFYGLTTLLLLLIFLAGDWPLFWEALLHGR